MCVRARGRARRGRVSHGSLQAIALGRAARSVSQYPARITSGRDAEALKFVGKDTARRIQRIIDNLDDSVVGPPAAVQGAPAASTSHNSHASAASNKRQRDGDANPAGQAPGKSSKAAVGAVKLSDLVMAGLLPVGGTVVCRGGGADWEGTVLASGAVRFRGSDYKSPGGFARAAFGAAGEAHAKPDGWAAVTFLGEPLQTLRARAEGRILRPVPALQHQHAAPGPSDRADGPEYPHVRPGAAVERHDAAAHVHHVTAGPPRVALGRADAGAGAGTGGSEVRVDPGGAGRGDTQGGGQAAGGSGRQGVRLPKVGSVACALMVRLYRFDVYNLQAGTHAPANDVDALVFLYHRIVHRKKHTIELRTSHEKQE